ncbi:MAG: autotransporter outer membrane beta-barrel domain-containing protein [Desulfovibrio sp.]|jgi:hypothetical protein|nr:autotransporter outer membrane beta-barrel domain-containing protein [Desulfovibrio sp.]
MVTLTGQFTNGSYSLKTHLYQASELLPSLSPGLQAVLDDMALGNGNSPFLKKVLTNIATKNPDLAAKTIESAARLATLAAAPQTAMLAATAATTGPMQRLTVGPTTSNSAVMVQRVNGAVNRSDGPIRHADGTVDRASDRTIGTGVALWVTPIYQSQEGWGMKSGNFKTGWNADLGGVALGGDVSFDSRFRVGATMQIGGGYAKGSGDLASTENSVSFWGLGAYAGVSGDQTLLAMDINYTRVSNSLKQQLPGEMSEGALTADVLTHAISVGLRGEYKFETSVADIVGHTGIRYLRLMTDGYNVKGSDGDVLKAEGNAQSIWSFPTGVTFSKNVALQNGWYLKPSAGMSIIPSVGDLSAKTTVRFTGTNRSADLDAETADGMAYQGTLGAEVGNEFLKVGLNYFLTVSNRTASHAGQLNIRYEF